MGALIVLILYAIISCFTDLCLYLTDDLLKDKLQNLRHESKELASIWTYFLM